MKDFKKNYKIKIYPWARALWLTKENLNYVLFTAAKTQARIDLGFQFLGPVITRTHILYKRASDNSNIKNLKDIRNMGLKVGGLRADWRVNYLRKHAIIAEKVNKHQQNIHKLLAGRIDLIIGSDIKTPFLTKEIRVNFDQLKPAFIIKKS